MNTDPITLWNEEGLIVLDENGNLYTNQTGGYSCNQREARGFFKPMTVPDFVKEYYDDPRKVNDYLKEMGALYRLDDLSGEEAWVYVYFLDAKGILTWENSD